MSDAPVDLMSSGPPETILDPEPDEVIEALGAAVESQDPVAAVAAVCAGSPRCLAAWATLGDLIDEPAISYAAYRTGYHRGLDRLRASGWRGSGFVRWENPTNRGFLRSLDGLRRKAAEIGEDDEEARCELFLRQLDPAWPPDRSAD
jgi:Protein of unknown function (DUF3151)